MLISEPSLIKVNNKAKINNIIVFKYINIA